MPTLAFQTYQVASGAHLNKLLMTVSIRVSAKAKREKILSKQRQEIVSQLLLKPTLKVQVHIRLHILGILCLEPDMPMVKLSEYRY